MAHRFSPGKTGGGARASGRSGLSEPRNLFLDYVKQVVFPLERLPVSAMGAALFHSAVRVGVLSEKYELPREGHDPTRTD